MRRVRLMAGFRLFSQGEELTWAVLAERSSQGARQVVDRLLRGRAAWWFRVRKMKNKTPSTEFVLPQALRVKNPAMKGLDSTHKNNV